MSYYVYIMANKKNGTIYTGMTNNLDRRVREHKNKVNKGFTEKYNLNKLVWFEDTPDINSAIEKEKKIKNRSRAYKLKLIETKNKDWSDLLADPATLPLRYRATG